MRKRNKGFTLIELIMIIVCIGVLSFLALPKFIDISAETQSASESEMVGNVNTALQLVYSENMVNGSASYPSTLDDADEGPSSSSNPFFTNVMQNAYRGDQWEKDGDGDYIGPAGNTYVYDSSTGTFEKSK